MYTRRGWVVVIVAACVASWMVGYSVVALSRSGVVLSSSLCHTAFSFSSRLSFFHDVACVAFYMLVSVSPTLLIIHGWGSAARGTLVFRIDADFTVFGRFDRFDRLRRIVATLCWMFSILWMLSRSFIYTTELMCGLLLDNWLLV